MNGPLAFHQPYPGGRIILMLGRHEVSAVFPPPNITTLFRPVWRWRFWLSQFPTEGKAKTEQEAKNAILSHAREWLMKAGVE